MNKQTAALLFGHSYQLEDKEGNVYNVEGVTQCPYDENEIRFELSGKSKNPVTTNKKIGTDYFIRCHRLSNLTKTIQHEGKDIIPLHELAKTVFKGDLVVFKSIHENIIGLRNEDNLLFRQVKGNIFSIEKEGKEILFDCQPIHDKLYELHFKPSQIPDEWVKWID